MLRKAAILGLILLAVGAAVHSWLLTVRRNQRLAAEAYKLKYASEADRYLERYEQWLKLPPDQRDAMPLQLDQHSHTRTNAQIHRQQQERLKADIDELATGQLQASPFAEVLYGPDWHTAVQQYKIQKERREFLLTASLVCIAIGGCAVAMSLLAVAARLIIKALGRLRKRPGGARLPQDKAIDRPAEQAGIEHQQTVTDDQPARIPLKQTLNLDPPARQKASPPPRSPAQHGSAPDPRLPDKAAPPPSTTAENPPHRQPGETRKIPLVTSPTPLEPKGKHRTRLPQTKNARQNRQTPLSNQPTRPLRTKRDGTGTLEIEQSLQARTEDLARQMDQLKRMARGAQLTAVEQSAPLNDALKELTHQVSAIREYAAHQQQRLEKLQDGYDWNIIRTFCLRLIRCIDNLELKIERLCDQGLETKHLEDVRDELVFALESSGVEQFRPQINSPYRGQEKSTEVVKERQPCDNPQKAGTIAKVVRPGYHYFIDENTVKVVRAAQVKLFG